MSSAGIGRRRFLTDSARAALGLGCLNVGVKVLAQKTPPLAAHNMLIVGTKTTFLYHLPLFSFPGFDSPRRYQIILRATFTTQQGRSLQDDFAAERGKNDKQIYTFGPERFGFSSAKDFPSTLKGTIFRGHLEKKGSVVPADNFRGVVAHIEKISYFSELNSNRAKDAALRYYLFGSPQELFMAHLLSKPPDFDQILSVNKTNKQLGAYAYGRPNYLEEEDRDGIPSPTVTITFPRRNLLSQRLPPASSIVGTSTKIYRSYVAETVEVTLGREYYFEEGELSAPPNYATTRAESDAGFP